MTRVRSLPIRLDPVDGESIDSYLEACAARMLATHGEVVDAVGIEQKLTGHRALAPWIVRLSSSEVTTVSAVTGVPAARLLTMTLADYDQRSVRIDQHRARLASGFPWGYTSGSRYCPYCLAENGGRWLLRWRLGWSFACMKHQCILAHECPKCSGLQRIRVHAARKGPRPGRCTYGDSRSTEPRCVADLASATVLQLRKGHPVLDAQQRVDSIIDGRPPRTGLYRLTSYSAAEMLSDVRDLAREALIHSDRKALKDLVSDDLNNEFEKRVGAAAAGLRECSSRSEYLRLNSRQVAPRDPVATAFGVAAAWAALGESDIESAGARIRLLLEKRQRQEFAPSWLADRSITSTLTEAYRNTIGLTVSAADLSRSKTHTRLLPAVPRESELPCELDRRLPTLLWESWSLRVPPSGHLAHTERQALSVAVAIVGTGSSFGEVKQRLGASIKHSTFNKVIDSLHASYWDKTAIMFERLADHLSFYGAPIDYRRRRSLDYSALLPRKTWIDLCLAHGLPEMARYPDAARLDLTERLSGMPVRLANTPPWYFDAIVRGRTPSLARALDRYCIDFLRNRGVRDEPVSWAPDLDVIRDLELKPDPESVDVSTLHRLIRRGKYSVADAAKALEITPRAAVFCLTQYPAPKRIRRV